MIVTVIQESGPLWYGIVWPVEFKNPIMPHRGYDMVPNMPLPTYPTIRREKPY